MPVAGPSCRFRSSEIRANSSFWLNRRLEQDAHIAVEVAVGARELGVSDALGAQAQDVSQHSAEIFEHFGLRRVRHVEMTPFGAEHEVELVRHESLGT